MRIESRWTALLTALLAAALCAAAAEPKFTVALKEQAAIAGETIRLGDLLSRTDGMPAELKELSLGNTPWPGRVREVSRMLVKARMIEAELDPGRFTFAGAECCKVRLKAIRIGADRIVEAARGHLRSHFPAGGPEVQVQLLRELKPVAVPAAGGVPELQPVISGNRSPVGTVRVYVDIVRDEGRLKRVPVSFMVRLFDRVLVSRRRIAPGEEFTPANVAVSRRDVTSVHGRCFRDVSELEGKTAARTVAPGTVLTHRTVEQADQPVLVERNQRVLLVVRTPTLRVVTAGKALQRGRRGEVVRAENLSTGKSVAGLAVERGTLRVPLGGAGKDAE